MTAIELHAEKLNLIEEILHLDTNDVVRVKKLMAKLCREKLADVERPCVMTLDEIRADIAQGREDAPPCQFTVEELKQELEIALAESSQGLGYSIEEIRKMYPERCL